MTEAAACAAPTASLAARIAARCALVLAGACASTEPASSNWRPLGGDATAITPVQFGGDGKVTRVDRGFVLEPGSPLTGFTLAAALPPCGYELELTAARLQGNDFFCGLTFPAADGCLSLILGGWGGAVCGLSCLDGDDAAHNATRRLRHFDNGRFYRVRVRVAAATVTVWLDDAEFLRQDLAGHAVAVRAELDPCQPLGFACFLCRAAVRDLRWRPLPP